MNNVTPITDILIQNFSREKTLKDIQQDYEDLELLIERERAANGDDSRRLKAINVLTGFQLKLVLEKLAEAPDKRRDSVVPTV